MRRKVLLKLIVFEVTVGTKNTNDEVKTAFLALYMTAFGCHPASPEVLGLQDLHFWTNDYSVPLLLQVLGYHHLLAESSLMAPAQTELSLRFAVPVGTLQLLEEVAAANISPAQSTCCSNEATCNSWQSNHHCILHQDF